MKKNNREVKTGCNNLRCLLQQIAAAFEGSVFWNLLWTLGPEGGVKAAKYIQDNIDNTIRIGRIIDNKIIYVSNSGNTYTVDLENRILYYQEDSSIENRLSLIECPHKRD